MMILKFIPVFALVNVLPGLALAFYLTRKKEMVGLFDRLIISAIISPLVMILVSFLEDAAGIPQSGLTLGLNVAVIGAGNVALLIRFFPQKENYLLRLGWVKVFAYVLFGALIFSRVWAGHDLLAPILHDPIAHSEWLKVLNTTQFTTSEQWYPQGLVLYLNYFATLLPVSYPQVVLVSANVMIAFFPISLFYLGLLTFEGKDRWMIFPLIVFVIAARLEHPNQLFYTYGKNSMIFAFALAPPLLYLAASLENRRDYIIGAFLMFAVIVVHYPTGFFLIFTLFLVGLRQIVAIDGRKFSFDRKVLSWYGTAAAASAGLGALLVLKILPIYQSHPASEDGSLYHTVLWLEQHGVIQFLYRNFLEGQLQAYHSIPVIFFAAALSAFLLARGANKGMTAKLLASFAALYLLGAFMLLSGNISLGINYNVEVRYFLVFLMVFVLAWFTHHILSRTVLRFSQKSLVSAAVVVLLGPIFFQGEVDQYMQYRTQARQVQTVRQEDLRSFDFISRNIKDDRKMLIQVGTPLPATSSGSMILGSDSGAWIPVFTDRKVEVDYRQFAGDRASRIFDLYMALAKNGQDLDAVRSLSCDYDIGYIFFGSRQIFFDNMKREVLDGSEYFEKIYDDGATIYRVKPVNCAGA